MNQLITPAYIEEQHKLHQDPGYGAGSHRYAHLLISIMHRHNCNSVLDYGAGKGTLAAEMRKQGIVISEYDPCVPGKESAPEPADLVVCIDVMEHIEPACFDAVLGDLARLSRKMLFVDIATKFDKHRWLSDGRNSHQIVNEGKWWENQLNVYKFRTIEKWETGLKAWIALMVSNANN